MALYECGLCANHYEEEREAQAWEELPDDWNCPICGSPKSSFSPLKGDATSTALLAHEPAVDVYPGERQRPFDDFETHMADIHRMAATGESITEPMRTRLPCISWEDILIKGAQLAKLPLNKDVEVSTRTVIGPGADKPLFIETPIYVTHMSFGALSREAKIALAKGSAAVKTAMASGEGGILEESLGNAYRYIFEYVPNEYSVKDDYLARVDAVEIKVGQSAKPGMGGHLPGSKVTEEIAAIRGFPPGTDIISPAHFKDIRDRDELKKKVDWLRGKTGGKPVGIKIAAGNIEADLDVALHAGPDFVTIDGRAGSTGASPKFVKATTSLPTLFALVRARKFLDERGAGNVSLLITGGFRVSPDFAKALALGANAVAIGTAALMACGCQQYRTCNTGKCPVGITTQDPELRKMFNIKKSAKRLRNYLHVCSEELKDFARLTGNGDVHGLTVTDLCTTNSEISNHTNIEHV